MASAADLQLLTAEEFLRIIFEPDMKVELVDGVVRMMTGGSLAHSRVQGNVAAWLRTALRGSPCRPFGPDMAVRTGPKTVRYPDVVVDCTGTDTADDDLTLERPRVVIEVLSPSTRANDEGAKLREYRTLQTVDTVALIDPLAEELQVYQRQVDGSWRGGEMRSQADLHLPSLGLTMPHAEIFARD